MITARRVLLVLALLVAAAGLAILLLPYDTTYVVPQIAGRANVEADITCKAPLVDLVTSEGDDDWLNYSPDEGVSFESDQRAGGELCAGSMLPRGALGVGLLFGATMIAAAAIVAGRRRDRDPDPDATAVRPELADG